MLSHETINQLLGITESYQAPQRMLDIMMDDKERPLLFDAFLELETDMSKEWFQSYFESEHSERKAKKQDFTPMQVSNLLARIVGQRNVCYEAAAGTGGILIRTWYESRSKVNPITYDPRSYWYHAEELSDRAVPFLIFNMAIRSMNGVVLHGDSLKREFKDVYFIRNNTADYLAYSDVIKMPRSEQLMKEVDVRKWVS